MYVAIVDYGMGNLVSVRNALEAVSAEPRIVTSGADLREAHAIVLPGVGAFGKGMAGLRERGFVEALEVEVREKKKPFLGLCLGLQLLADRGLELGENEGLGWVPGTVRRLEGTGVRVPHVGWNDVRGKSPLLRGLPEGASFYFVHSFHFDTTTPEAVTGVTEHGQSFCSMVDVENVHAVQFHPEKSHKHGLALLRNFLALAKGS